MAKGLSNDAVFNYINSVPSVVSDCFYKVMNDIGGKKPRFDSVYKMCKEQFVKDLGCSYNALTENQKYELKSTAEDTYWGIRQAEFGE